MDTSQLDLFLAIFAIIILVAGLLMLFAGVNKMND